MVILGNDGPLQVPNEVIKKVSRVFLAQSPILLSAIYRGPISPHSLFGRGPPCILLMLWNNTPNWNTPRAPNLYQQAISRDSFHRGVQIESEDRKGYPWNCLQLAVSVAAFDPYEPEKEAIFNGYLGWKKVCIYIIYMIAVQKPMKGFTWSRSTGIDLPDMRERYLSRNVSIGERFAEDPRKTR